MVLEHGQRETPDMRAGMRKSMLSLPLAVLASVIASLLAVWALSKAAGFHFNPAVVAALSAAISAAVISVRVRRAI